MTPRLTRCTKWRMMYNWMRLHCRRNSRRQPCRKSWQRRLLLILCQHLEAPCPKKWRIVTTMVPYTWAKSWPRRQLRELPRADQPTRYQEATGLHQCRWCPVPSDHTKASCCWRGYLAGSQMQSCENTPASLGRCETCAPFVTARGSLWGFCCWSIQTSRASAGQPRLMAFAECACYRALESCPGLCQLAPSCTGRCAARPAPTWHPGPMAVAAGRSYGRS
mmetsp:Transcript_48868/g.106466  ORF Transcript_48868/g.106466 Transcript_48868/m.106466 type:complete len:221 (-) Transcript_48868:446-1108(-)